MSKIVRLSSGQLKTHTTYKDQKEDLVNHDVEILIDRTQTYSVSINHFMLGRKKEQLTALNLNHDRKVRLQNVYQVLCLRSSITFSLNWKQIRRNQVMRSLLSLSFLLVLFAALSPTTAHNVKPPRCATGCCFPCHLEGVIKCSKTFREPGRGCGIGNYCDDHCSHRKKNN